jgi:hypothetical protein
MRRREKLWLSLSRFFLVANALGFLVPRTGRRPVTTRIVLEAGVVMRMRRIKLCFSVRKSLTHFFLACFSLATLAIVVSFISTRLAAAADAPAGNGAAPILVELFTSEGCSSCPPADALLGKLDASQGVAGVQPIVLSEHVDYWNHDGWKDAYSSSFFTSRQGDYVRRLGLKDAYTPQMVVDGVAQVNGSDGRAVAGALETARGRMKVPVRIVSVAADGKTLRVHLSVDALPEDFKARKADVFLAVALNRAESHVSAGENKGRDIRHVAVAESIDKVGAVEKEKNFDREVVVKVKAGDPANLRVVAFVQEADAGEVIGAALMSPAVSGGADRATAEILVK